jgi:hypothetical protein
MTKLKTETQSCQIAVNGSADINILIGCEESQAITKAFRKLGFNAYSNDLKECSGGHPEWHLKMDVFEAIKLKDWHFIGLHPVCTKMTLSGNRHYAPGKPKHNERIEAVDWTIKLWQTACEKTNFAYMENPMGAMNGDLRLSKPQTIQPYYFGDEFQKTTCLWLHNLNPLYHNKEPNLFDSDVTHVGKGEMIEFISKKGKKKSQPKWYADALSLPAYERSEVRSKTFPGIAEAMAKQWGNFLLETLT